MKLGFGTIKTNIVKYLLSFMQAQLIVSIVSIPVLVGWGLQISIMTWIGNLIFFPVLIIFLILSSLVFFTQICHIPNKLLIKSLELISQIWNYCLNLGEKYWLVGFHKPNFWILILIPTVSFLILYSMRNKSRKLKIVILSLLLTIVVIGLSVYPIFFKSSKTQCFENGKLIIQINDNFEVTITDKGFFNQRASQEKFVNYDIKQFLIKNTGNSSIHTLIIKKPGYRSFRAAQECCSWLKVDKLALPYFKIKLNKNAWREYFRLKKLTAENNTDFIRY